MIGIIDYGLGNLRSVQKALESVGAPAVIVSSPEGAPRFSKIVLPGVGAFADGMTLLQQRGWDSYVEDFVASGRPLLGICLGMQLLFEGSQEDAPSADQPVKGLALLPGQALRFDEDRSPGPRLKVPHMGWNSLHWTRDDPLFAGIEQDAAVYFVHSYYVEPSDQPDAPLTSARSDYGAPFCASIWHRNIWATQFHPEKSQRVGLKILANFAAL